MAGISGRRAKLEMLKKFNTESLLFNEKFFVVRLLLFLSCAGVQAFFHFSEQIFSKVCCLQRFGKTAEGRGTVSSLESGGVARGDITSP